MRPIVFSLFSVCLWAQAPRVGVGLTQTRLSLEDAVRQALQNNLEIEIERTNQETARRAILGARAYLDPLLRLQPLAEKRNTPTGNVLAAPDGKLVENFFNTTLSYRQRLNWQAMSFHADFDAVRQSTNNPFVALNPFVTPRLVFGVTLPLWRDRKTDRERTELLVRRKQADLSDIEFELRVIDVVARVEQAYYDLVAAREDLGVYAESVNLGREQLERTRRLIEAGSLAPVELAAAEAELERRKDSYYSALTQLNVAENNLKLLLAGGRQESLWKDELVPTTTSRAELPPEAKADLGTLISQALARRVELRAISVRKQVNDAQRDLALNLRKPAVQLTANYTNSGLAGTALATQNPFSAFNLLLVERLNELSKSAGLAPLAGGNFGGRVPADLVGGYGQSLANLFSGRFQTVQAGLSFDLNFRNSAAESALAQAAVAERRIDLERKRTEQAIEAQLRNALQAVETSQQRILAAEASARAAKEKLDSEVRLFQTGESTNFFVLTRQNEFADSRRRVVLATLEFNKSVARLAFALGLTLQTHQIRLQ
ncbi:MAG: TolC family protein [Bryobacteraceae bacterium]|nr:TolC family protein [Bryobacteraceae bacterium]MDW8377007.1 TolC family protein [Bryobacterales bacterium]